MEEQYEQIKHAAWDAEDAGDLGRAGELVKEGIDLALHRHDDDAVLELLSLLSDLIDSFLKHHQVHEAVRLQQRLVEVSRHVGYENPSVMASLARRLDAIGDLDGAIHMRQEALNLAEARLAEELGTFSQEEPNALFGLASLVAELRQAAGDTPAAERCLRAALGACNRWCPEYDHARRDLAIILADSGRPDEAISLFRSVLEARTRWLGRESPHLSGDVENLARALELAGRPDEAADVRSALSDPQPNSGGAGSRG